jgi:hypothetical protein
MEAVFHGIICGSGLFHVRQSFLRGEKMQEDIKELKDIKTMASILSVPVSRLYSETRRRGAGTIPLVRIGKYCRFHVPSVIAYFQTQTRAGNE